MPMENNIQDFTKDTDNYDFILFARYKKTPTMELRNLIVTNNLNLVYKISSLYKTDSIDAKELQQEGFIGLIKAVDTFDYNRGIKFSTYAVQWIRQAISRYIDNNSRTIRLPVRYICDYRKFSRLKQQYILQYGAEPTNKYLSDNLGLCKQRIEQLADTANMNIISLNTPDRTGSDNCEASIQLQDVIDDCSAVLPLQQIELDIDMKMLLKNIERITTAEEYDILLLRCGFYNDQPYTLKETGIQLGIAPNQVHRIEQRVLKRIRKTDFFKNIQDFREYLY